MSIRYGAQGYTRPSGTCSLPSGKVLGWGGEAGGGIGKGHRFPGKALRVFLLLSLAEEGRSSSAWPWPALVGPAERGEGRGQRSPCLTAGLVCSTRHLWSVPRATSAPSVAEHSALRARWGGISLSTLRTSCPIVRCVGHASPAMLLSTGEKLQRQVRGTGCHAHGEGTSLGLQI